MKSKVLVSSILTIALCLSLIAGSTFALFTDQTKFGIEVTSGDVEIYASAAIDAVWSAQGDANDVAEDEYLEDENGHGYNHVDPKTVVPGIADNTFINGGDAVVTGANLTLNRVTPGDRVDVTIKVDNKSDVAMVYRYKIIAEDVNLAYGMVVSVQDDASAPVVAYEGLATWTSKWYPVIPAVGGKHSPIPDYTFTVELPVYAGNEYQSEHAGNQYYDENGDEQFYAEDVIQTVNYTVLVEAVQGNAVTDDESQATIFPEAIARRIAQGGVVDGNGAIIASDSKAYITKNTTLTDITFNTDNLKSYEILIADGNEFSGSLVLDEGTVLDVAKTNGQGFAWIFGEADVTVKSDALINVTGEGAMGLNFQECKKVTLKLEDTGLIKVAEGCYGINFENVSVANIYVPTVEAYEEYKAMTGSGAKQINWYINGALVADSASKLDDVIANAQPGDTITLGDADLGTVTVAGNLKDVTFKATSADAAALFKIEAGAVLENVTFSGFTFEGYNGINGSYAGAVDIMSGATADITFENCTFKPNAGYSAVRSYDESTKVKFVGCTIDGARYVFYKSGAPITELVIDNCTISNIASWMTQTHGGTVATKVSITNCNLDKMTGFVKCGSAYPAGSTFVFANNTITNSQPKDGKWFEINVSNCTTVDISGNTMDGANWNPGSAEGIKP